MPGFFSFLSFTSLIQLCPYSRLKLLPFLSQPYFTFPPVKDRSYAQILVASSPIVSLSSALLIVGNSSLIFLLILSLLRPHSHSLFITGRLIQFPTPDYSTMFNSNFNLTLLSHSNFLNSSNIHRLTTQTIVMSLNLLNSLNSRFVLSSLRSYTILNQSTLHTQMIVIHFHINSQTQNKNIVRYCFSHLYYQISKNITNSNRV
jgi:hypothetical protein